MEANGQVDLVLHWPGRVMAADDVRRHVNGHRELVLAPQTIVTPLAAEQLRADGVLVRRQGLAVSRPENKPLWGYAQDRPHPVVASAIQSLARDGAACKELAPIGTDPVCSWARSVAECIARGECRGGILFCQDSAVVCCVANKVLGLRAASVSTVAQAARAMTTLGPNLVVVEMPGRTFYEVRQIMRTVCVPNDIVCPPGVACTLQELESHAHR